jgi:hypothetical protein
MIVLRIAEDDLPRFADALLNLSSGRIRPTRLDG